MKHRTTNISSRRQPLELAATLVCPRDHFPLELHRRAHASLHVCGSCAGLWVTREQFEIWLKARNATEPSPAMRVTRSRKSSRIACPSCAGETLQIFKVKKIEIDVCPGCRGMWFDAGELSRLKVWQLQNPGAGSPGAAAGTGADVTHRGISRVVDGVVDRAAEAGLEFVLQFLCGLVDGI